MEKLDYIFNNMKKVIFAVVFLVCIFSGHAFADDIKFEISLDRSKIALGESSQLGLSFYGTQSMPAPDIGNIDGLEVRYVGPSTMMTVINGQMSSSITHLYSILPLKPGKFQLGPFNFTNKGNNYKSNIIFLEVSEEKPIKAVQTEPPVEQKLDIDDRIFVVLKAAKMSSYVNELVPVSVKLYVNRLNVSDIQLPTFEQENFSKIAFKEPKQYKEQMGGVVYDVLEFNTQIFGTRPGDYKLGPAKIKCNVLLRKRISRTSGLRNDPFRDDFFNDSFFEDAMSGYQRYPLELKSEEAQLVVSPLPSEGRPKDYTGAIGDYQFIFDASPKKLKTGDPVTVRMSINGKGNFNTVLIPKLETTEGFRAYEAQVKTEENSKTFMQVLIPETDGIKAIPSATFSYFDPAEKQYKTITQGPIPIQIEKSRDEGPSQVVGPVPSAPAVSPEQENLARDMIYIKESPGVIMPENYQIYKKPLFMPAVVFSLMIVIVFCTVQGKRNRFRNDTLYAERVMAYRLSRTSAKNLKTKINQDDPKIFYESLFKSLQEYLGNRFHIPSAGITYAAIEDRLVEAGTDVDMMGKVRNLFAECDRLRFGYSASSEQKMLDDLMELGEVMAYFEKKKI